MGRLGAARQGGATPWWLSGGIAAANCVAAYQPKGAASYAASKTNLANPGVDDAYEGVAPGWDASNGWVGAIGKYLLGPNISARNVQAVIIRYANGASNQALIGQYHGSGMLIHLAASGVMRYANCSSVKSDGANILTATLAISGAVAYADGAAVITDLAIGARLNLPIYMMATDNWGLQYYFTGQVYLVAFYNIPISAAQVAALTAAMAAL